MNVRFLLACLVVAGLSLQVAHAQQPPASPQALETHGDIQFVHDPALIREGATFYLFSTGNGPERKGEIPIRCSQDLHQWQKCGYVFAQIPDWIKKERGWLSSRAPPAWRREMAASRSGTRKAMWCNPGPRFSRNLAMGESGAVGASSSMRESPAGSMATSTFSVTTVSRCATASPRDW